jgi:hypothetical protein
MSDDLPYYDLSLVSTEQLSEELVRRHNHCLIIMERRGSCLGDGSPTRFCCSKDLPALVQLVSLVGPQIYLLASMAQPFGDDEDDDQHEFAERE